MIETQTLAAELAAKVLATVKNGNTPIFREVLSLGRKLKGGQIQIIGTEVYAGPDDGRASYAYIRFRDLGNEHSFAPTKGLTSAPSIEVRAHLRLVAVHLCSNEGEIQSALLAALLTSGPKMGVRIAPIAGSQRGQTVLVEETNDAASFLQTARLCAIDFDLIYNLGGDEAACNVTCDGCC